MEIKDIRKEYDRAELRRKDLNSNPFSQFNQWLNDALSAKVAEPTAMALATSSKEGKPSCRFVLMKRFDEEGLVFYTNLNSRKARDLNAIPYAWVTFFWKELERQVHVEGKVSKVSEEEARLYFNDRPLRSRLSAWASPQDEVLASRSTLEERYANCEARFKDQEIPLPPFWGGFRLHPERFEFWQGRPDRLHDRFQYVQEEKDWIIERLAP